MKLGRRSGVRFGLDDRALMQCVRCKRKLPETQFSVWYNFNRRITYRGAKCLRCQKQLKFEYASHPCMTPEIQTFLTKLIPSSKGGARARGIVYALTLEDLMRMWVEQRGCCALTGIPMTLGSGISRMRETRRCSIDRKSSLGNYTVDNVHLVCQIVNIMKSDLTMEEFGFWCQRVVLHALKLEDAA